MPVDLAVTSYKVARERAFHRKEAAKRYNLESRPLLFIALANTFALSNHSRGLYIPLISATRESLFVFFSANSKTILTPQSLGLAGHSI